MNNRPTEFTRIYDKNRNIVGWVKDIFGPIGVRRREYLNSDGNVVQRVMSGSTGMSRSMDVAGNITGYGEKNTMEVSPAALSNLLRSPSKEGAPAIIVGPALIIALLAQLWDWLMTLPASIADVTSRWESYGVKYEEERSIQIVAFWYHHVLTIPAQALGELQTWGSSLTSFNNPITNQAIGWLLVGTALMFMLNTLGKINTWWCDKTDVDTDHPTWLALKTLYISPMFVWGTWLLSYYGSQWLFR